MNINSKARQDRDIIVKPSQRRESIYETELRGGAGDYRQGQGLGGNGVSRSRTTSVDQTNARSFTVS